MSSGSENSATTPPTETIARKKGSGRTGLYVAIAVIVVIVLVVAGGYAAGWFKASSTASSTSCGSGSSFVPAQTASSSIAAPATAASPARAVTPAGGQTLDGAGSTLVAPLMDAWSIDYTNNTVNYASVGSGAGIDDITAKTVDFGASDAPLSPTQTAAIPSPGVVTIPESAGAVVPVYNLPTVSATLKFTGPILAAMYLGTITNWNNSALQAVNPGVVLPNACILIVHRSDGSGTTFAFSHYLSLENKTWNSTIGFATSVNWPTGIGSKGNSGVTATVKSTVDALGYVDINYALTNGVSFGSVQNPSGNYVVANITNIASAITDSHLVLPAGNGNWYNVSVENAPGAHDYPIATLTYVFVYTDVGVAYGSGYTQAKAEALVDWLHWMITVGQGYSAVLYYIPLPSFIVTADNTTINSLTYNGAAIP
ncbi:MAG: phosphate ABC transporter substrate-binding protein PstS [Thermoplasmata archaeon]